MIRVIAGDCGDLYDEYEDEQDEKDIAYYECPSCGSPMGSYEVKGKGSGERICMGTSKRRCYDCNND